MSNKNGGLDKNNNSFQSVCRQPLFILNSITLVAMIVVIIMFTLFFLEGRQQNETAVQAASDARDVGKATEAQSKANGDVLNQTLARIVAGQDKANIRGNLTLNELIAIGQQNNATLLTLVDLLSHRTPVFEDIVKNQVVLIENQFKFAQQLNVSGVSNQVHNSSLIEEFGLGMLDMSSESSGKVSGVGDGPEKVINLTEYAEEHPD